MPGVRGRVFDVQHYAVHDGPGIRTLVFFKGCPLRCAWCCNPESQSAQTELWHLAVRCRGCLRCVEACPMGAARRDEHGGPRFERVQCRECLDALDGAAQVRALPPQAPPCAEACVEGALRAIGRTLDEDEIVARVARDHAFYRNSGGGVTFSGGEPLAQPDLLLAVLAGSRALGIHTAVGTCGEAPPAVLEAVAPLVDLFLFDVKLVDAVDHRRWTGRDPARIHENLRRLATLAPRRVTLRLPLVPGVTDTDDNLAAVAALAREAVVATLILEPYHALGHDKYAALGRRPPFHAHPPDPGAVARAADLLGAQGLAVEVS